MSVDTPFRPPLTLGSAVAGRATPLGHGLLRRVLTADSATFWLATLAVGLGIWVRYFLVQTGEGFPLNDGGMFYSLVEDIKHSGYRLPEFASYNGGSIPFAYPFLAFYAAVGLSAITGATTLQVLNFLPLLFSILTIPAFFFLAAAMLPTRLSASLAVLVFAVIPRSFNWEIVGGGLTRSPGLFFAILAIWQGYMLITTQRRMGMLTTSLLASLAVLCHLQMGWFVVFSLGLMVAMLGRNRTTALQIAIVAVGVAVLTAPWWLRVLFLYGPDPLLSALQSGDHSLLAPLRLLALNFTEEPFFPVAMALGLLGLAWTVRTGRWLLSLWLMLIFVLDPRKAATLAQIPLPMLAAVALTEVLGPMLLTVAPDGATTSRWGYGALGFLLLVYSPVAAIGSASQELSPLTPLSSGNREAMAWVKNNTPADALFVVMPSELAWAIDAPAEWFPTLTERISVNTVQGSEWLGHSQFPRLVDAYKTLSSCTSRNVDCLEAWARSGHWNFSYVYVPKGASDLGGAALFASREDCCAAFAASLSDASDFTKIYDGAGAIIFARKPLQLSPAATQEGPTLHSSADMRRNELALLEPMLEARE